MAQATGSSPVTGSSPAGSSPLFPGILSTRLSQIPPGKSLQQSADKKVSQAAGNSLNNIEARSSSEKVNYTSVEEITRTCLQCRELRAMVNEVLSGREMVDKMRQKVTQNLLENMERESVRKIRQKRPDLDEIVQMHLSVMKDFALYQSLVLAEIVKLRGMIKHECDAIATLLAKRKGDLEEVKASENDKTYDDIMKAKEIQALVKTLKNLVCIQSQLERTKLSFESLEMSEEQEFLIADFKEAKLEAIRQAFEKISIKSLPKVKADEIGTVKGELLAALTKLIIVTQRQITEQLQIADVDLKATQRELREYEDALPDGQEVQVVTLEKLEEQFAFNADIVEKLENYRNMSAEVSVLAKLVEAENGPEYLLDNPVRKALLKQRLEELKQFKEKSNSIEKLREGMVHWVTAVDEGSVGIGAIYQLVKDALKRFDEVFPKKDECCSPCRKEECPPVGQKEESASPAVDE